MNAPHSATGALSWDVTGIESSISSAWRVYVWDGGQTSRVRKKKSLGVARERKVEVVCLRITPGTVNVIVMFGCCC